MDRRTDAQLRADNIQAASRFAFLWAWVIAQEKNLADITTQTNLACQKTKVDPPLFALAYLKQNKEQLKAMKTQLNQWIQQHCKMARPNSRVTITDTGVVVYEPCFTAPELDITPEQMDKMLADLRKRKESSAAAAHSAQKNTAPIVNAIVKPVENGDSKDVDTTTSSKRDEVLHYSLSQRLHQLKIDHARSQGGRVTIECGCTISEDSDDDYEAEAEEALEARLHMHGLEPISDLPTGPKDKPSPSREWWD